MRNYKRAGLILITLLGIATAGGLGTQKYLTDSKWKPAVEQETAADASLEEIPEYTGMPYVEINGGQPEFAEVLFTTEAMESYQELDELGRCQTAYANVGIELMPEEKRGEIGSVHPSGWHTVKYDKSVIEEQYLYNRCHLIAYQLSGENANERNLITGTRYMNVTGMLPFEEAVGDYVRETGNHVLYRGTPIFEGTELVARGVQMEAESVEDHGNGIQFNVFVYNVQPGIIIDYQTGESWLSEDSR